MGIGKGKTFVQPSHRRLVDEVVMEDDIDAYSGNGGGDVIVYVDDEYDDSLDDF